MSAGLVTSTSTPGMIASDGSRTVPAIWPWANAAAGSRIRNAAIANIGLTAPIAHPPIQFRATAFGARQSDFEYLGELRGRFGACRPRDAVHAIVTALLTPANRPCQEDLQKSVSQIMSQSYHQLRVPRASSIERVMADVRTRYAGALTTALPLRATAAILLTLILPGATLAA